MVPVRCSNQSAFLPRNFTFLEPDESRFEVLNYTSVFKSNDQCSRDLQVQQCTLLPALLEYRVLLTNDSIALDPNFSYKDDQVVKYTPAYGFYGQGPGSTHGGMELVLSATFNSEASLVFNGAVGYDLVTSGAPTYQYSSSDFNPQDCNIAWSDPTDDMLGTARDLAFRTALRAANVTNTINIQVFGAVEHNTLTVYKSLFLFHALALVFTLLATLCVMPIFMGFWTLGRNVALSPIEVAKAFNAPILSNYDSNASVHALLDEVGAREIRYGSVQLTPGGQEKLLMSEPRWVATPEEGASFVG
jgi:hypothetical protein